jgi:hypothetical protein
MNRAEGRVTHNAMREGAALGFVIATSIWIWIAIVDAVAGEPFRTAIVLGGVIQFTILHYVLNVAYGMAVVAVVYRTAEEPGLAAVLWFVLVVVEFAFVMATILLSHLGLGAFAWLRIFGASLIGLAIAIFILSRRHRLVSGDVYE